MSLDNGVADGVRFHCATCGREYSPRQIRNGNAICVQCHGNNWNMVTDYREVEANQGFMSIVTEVIFGPILGHMLNRETKMIQIDTPEISADEVLAICNAGRFEYRKWAYKYMELRRRLDGERDRQALRERGGKNCTTCNMFFMPASDKPWTLEGYCSKRCSPHDIVPVEVQATVEPPPTTAPKVPTGRMVRLVCSCGHQFQVSAMYMGILRPCPSCNKRIMVS